MANKDYVRRGQGSSKSNQRKKAQPKKPWRAGLVAAIFVSLFGYGLYTLSKDPEPPVAPPVVKPQPQPQPTQQKRNSELPPLPKEEWDFVTSLPNKEIEIEAKQQVVSSIPYIMQCGAFKSLSQAEERKANIAFQGISSRIHQKEGSSWYRVILGPYTLKREAERDRHKLQRAKIEPCAIWKESL